MEAFVIKTVSKFVRIKVNAGMQFGSSDYKIKHVATDIFKHTIAIWSDGDNQLIASVRVKRIFKN